VEQGVGGEGAGTTKVLWVLGLVAVFLLGGGSYGVRELFLAWLAFAVLFVAGSLLVIAAYVVGAAVEWTVHLTRTQLRRACGGFSSARIHRQCLVAVGPTNKVNETADGLAMKYGPLDDHPAAGAVKQGWS
jgi:hypothetical protein